jgi:hypothetical protein
MQIFRNVNLVDLSSKSQLYGDSEDEGLKDIDTERTEDSISGIKYYKTGYQDNTSDIPAPKLSSI